MERSGGNSKGPTWTVKIGKKEQARSMHLLCSCFVSGFSLYELIQNVSQSLFVIFFTHRHPSDFVPDLFYGLLGLK